MRKYICEFCKTDEAIGKYRIFYMSAINIKYKSWICQECLNKMGDSTWWIIDKKIR